VLNGFALSELVSADLFSYQGGPAGSSNVNEGTGSDGPQLLATQLSDLFPSPPPDSPFNFLSKFSDFLHQMFSPNGTGAHMVLTAFLVMAGLALLPTDFAVLGVVLAGAGIVLLIADILDAKNAELCLPAFLGGSGDCPWFGVKIDPSGNVVDTSGNPINGATTTLLSQGPSGFNPVDPSSGAIDPAQNPETTGNDGAFEWEALAGTYEVQATAPNCHAPGNPSQPNVTTAPFVIPPPKVGLLLALECPGSTPPTPTVTGVSAGIGPSAGGNRVEIMGTGLADASAVHFGSAPATAVTPISPFAVAAIAPAGTSTVDVTVTTPGGTSATSGADQYTYVPFPASPAAPSISSVTPGNGPVWGGTSVAIKGSNLDGVFAVSFAGVPAVQVTDVSSTEVDAVTPSSLLTGPVDVTVTGPDGTSAINGSDVFNYTTGVSASTTTSLTSSDNPSAVGEQVAYTATVTPVPSGGTVKFRDGGVTIPGCGSQTVDAATGIATCMVTYSSMGTHTIDAVYSGSPSFAGSTSNAITQTVNQAATTVTLLFSPPTPVFGSPDTIMATVGATAPGAGTPTGSVSFYENGSLVAKVSLSGASASISALLQPGTQSIKAVYSGDTNFTGSNTTASKSVGCTKALSGKVTGSMTVPPGQSLCLLSKDVVKGSIKVQAGGALSVAGGSSVSGSISANGATGLMVCAGTVTGGATITGSTGFVLLGDTADDMTPSCGPDTFNNSLYLSGNKAGVELGGSTIKGSVTLNNTTITAPPPFGSIAEDLAAPELESNAVTENLSCSGNSPAPINDGHPNSVKGTKTGQCSGL
jgi:hypothetical protein